MLEIAKLQKTEIYQEGFRSNIAFYRLGSQYEWSGELCSNLSI